MKTLRTVMEVEDSGIVTVRGRYGEMFAKFRMPLDSFGTFTRIEPGSDCDNYWIGIKPSDGTVHGTTGAPPLFDSRATLTVTNFKFTITR